MRGDYARIRIAVAKHEETTRELVSIQTQGLSKLLKSTKNKVLIGKSGKQLDIKTTDEGSKGRFITPTIEILVWDFAWEKMEDDSQVARVETELLKKAYEFALVSTAKIADRPSRVIQTGITISTTESSLVVEGHNEYSMSRYQTDYQPLSTEQKFISTVIRPQLLHVLKDVDDKYITLSINNEKFQATTENIQLISSIISNDPVNLDSVRNSIQKNGTWTIKKEDIVYIVKSILQALNYQGRLIRSLTLEFYKNKIVIRTASNDVGRGKLSIPNPTYSGTEMKLLVDGKAFADALSKSNGEEVNVFVSEPGGLIFIKGNSTEYAATTEFCR